jgi:hypothetical protein
MYKKALKLNNMNEKTNLYIKKTQKWNMLQPCIKIYPIMALYVQQTLSTYCPILKGTNLHSPSIVLFLFILLILHFRQQSVGINKHFVA